MTTKKQKREAGERRAEERAAKDAARRHDLLVKVNKERARKQRQTEAEARRRQESGYTAILNAMFPREKGDS